MYYKKIFFTILFNSFFFLLNAQEKKQQPDSTKIYQDIHDLSKKSKFNKFVYKLLFRSSALKVENGIPEKKNKTNEQIVKKANGKIIRNITIETLDPFGYSIKNATKQPENGFEKFGNAIHLKTKVFTIKNLLLFKKNDELDTQLLKETERLIRSQRYIREVSVTPELIDKNSDSVDVAIRVLDSWSLIPNGSVSGSQNSVKLTERNIFGFGHQISGEIKNRNSPDEQAIYGRYTINNIKNSFFKLDLEYASEFNNDSKRSIAISRPFYSVVANNAGGVYFENRTLTEFFPVADSLVNIPTKFEFQEYWYGRSFKINKGNSFENKTTNLIIAATYNRKNYLLTPDEFYDTTSFFSSENNVIGYIGISRQKFYQDTFIFNYDIIEDIPYGENIAVTFGYQDKNLRHSWYTGISVSKGKKYNFGYFSGFFELGNFIEKYYNDRTILKAGFNYFSPLFSLGKWRIRQFIKPTYIWGNNRDSSFKDQLTLNNYYGIEGFNNRLIGSQKWLLSLQTQTYMPGSWKGFRFSPYFNISMGALANRRELFDSKVFSKFSIGIQINNDYLVFNSFQVSLSYYPAIPFEGNNLFRTNSFENTDLTFNDFQLGKPSYVRYE